MPDRASLRYHLAQLAALCRTHPLEPKVILTPAPEIARDLEEALARAGVSWINLHLTTPAAWAERLAAPRLRAAGRRPIEPDADRFFALDTAKRARFGRRLPGRGAQTGGLVETLLPAVRGLRLAGIDPEEIERVTSGLDGRGLLVELYRAYCTWLGTEASYDLSDVYREAEGRPVPGVEPIVAILDETPLTETAYRFVRSMSGRVVRIGRPEYGTPAPPHSARARFAAAPIVSDGEGTSGPAGAVRLGGVAPSARPGIMLREAVGAEFEVRGALRELLRRGVSLDRVELVYTAEDPYLPLLVDALDRFELPATWAAGVPAPLTRTGQAIIGFYGWIASGFDPGDLVRLLRSRLLVPPADRVDAHAASEAARALLEARVGPGRHSWRPALEQFRDQLGTEAAIGPGERRPFLEARQADVRRTIGWMRELFSLLPRQDPASLPDLGRAGIRFIDRFTPRATTGREHRATESLRERIRNLTDRSSAKGALPELAATLIGILQDFRIDVDSARPGHAYVVPLERSGYSGREHTVVFGLSESTFPLASAEDLVFLPGGGERQPDEPAVLQPARAVDPTWHLVRLLSAAAGKVVLTASRRELVEGRETFPAAIFEQLKQQLDVKHPPVYQIVPEPDEVLASDEAAMALRARPAATEEWLEGRPWLTAGLKAVRSRASTALGAFDGWLERATPELRPGPSVTLSASRLEDLASCPYRYFLRNVVRVRPPDWPEELPGHWLSPIEFGSLLHEVLRTFMETVQERGERVDAVEHAPLMADTIDRAVARTRARLPVRHEAGFRVDVKRLRRAASIFLTEESRRDVRPVGFEVSFGMGQSSGLASPDPVTIRLSDDAHVALVGSIDRVDAVDGGYEVWDYKSGSGNDYDEADMLSGGRHLQWALYAYVLDELLDRAGLEGRTTRSGYFFTNDREHGLRLGDVPPPREAVGRALGPLFDMVEQGAFLHVQKREVCTFCDYGSVCSSERKGARDLKDLPMDDSEAPFLPALRRWMEV